MREIETEMLIPSNFGLNDQRFSTMAFSTLFEDNNFLTKTQLEGKLGTKINFLDYVNLKQTVTKNAILKNGMMKTLNNFEMPEYICKRLHALFDPKKGSQRFRKYLNMTNMYPPNLTQKNVKKILKIKLCKGNEVEVLKSIQNIHLPRYILDFKARIILGKTQFNSQLEHWTNAYTSQANWVVILSQPHLCIL